MNITKRGDGIFEKHHTKTGEHVFEILGLKLMNLCIYLQKIDARSLVFIRCSQLTRHRQHWGRDIDASDRSAMPNSSCQAQGGMAAATANIQCARVRPELEFV